MIDNRFQAQSWLWKPYYDRTKERIIIDLVRGSNGVDRYRVRYPDKYPAACLSKYCSWEYEPLPSNRDDDFLKRCRFSSLEEVVEILTKMVLI